MKIEHSAFDLLPGLRDRIIDPAESKFRFLDYVEIDRRAAEAGYPPDWRRTDEEREAMRAEFFAGREGQSVWVFAYGSLMWDPGFYFDEVRVGHASGFQRKFCLNMTRGRGSEETPGLMAALDEGAGCQGLVFRIAAEHADHETAVIWRREMISYGYDPRFVPVETDIGSVEAMTFVVNKSGGRYLGDLDLDASARRIATATGINGSNRDYADNLAAQLQLLGLSDPEFEALHERVRAHP